jgi:septal ring factor EnvC (AmiA/AmiB activator)
MIKPIKLRLGGFFFVWIIVFIRSLFFAVCLLGAGTALAADTRQQLQQVEATLQEKKAAAERAARAVGNSTVDVKRIQEQLQQAAQDESEQQKALESLTAEKDDLQVKADAAKAELGITAKRQSAALGMMVRLSQLPVAAWWLTEGISLDQERRMLLLRGSAQGLGQQAEKLRQAIALADALQDKLLAKQEQLVTARGKLQERADLLNTMIAERQKMAREHRSEFSALQREMTELTSAASDLRVLLDKMAQKQQIQPSKQGKLAAAGKNVEPQEAASADNASLLPVSGLLMRGFGAHDAYGITSRGLTLSAKAGARVVAPMAGKVVFVGPFKGYGSIVILQHSSGLHSLLAGFGKIDLELGQKVLSGEPIGVVGAGKGSAAPEIYFELRRNGEPINPLTVKKQQT